MLESKTWIDKISNHTQLGGIEMSILDNGLGRGRDPSSFELETSERVAQHLASNRLYKSRNEFRLDLPLCRIGKTRGDLIYRGRGASRWIHLPVDDGRCLLWTNITLLSTSLDSAADLYSVHGSGDQCCHYQNGACVDLDSSLSSR